MMNYKGYIGVVEYDADAHIFSGNVINTRTVITFEGTSVSEIEQEFQNSVDDYLEWCKEDGVEPEKPYSGRFVVRIAPETHQRIAACAATSGVSINKFVEKAIMDELLLAEG